jgi:hypothetical protein
MRRRKRRSAEHRRRLRRWAARQREVAMAEGYRQFTAWVPGHVVDYLATLARQWGVFRAHVGTAALEVGLRHLRADDAIRAQRHWQALGFGLPVAPVWPGAPEDRSRRPSNRRLNAARAQRRKERDHAQTDSQGAAGVARGTPRPRDAA